MERVILHCDLNSFYASVELLSHPELKPFPVAVCGDPESRHGIILAKNEPAKARGIQTAETIWQARKKCPGLILLPAHHERYAWYSKEIRGLYETYTDLVEPFGPDECWLDMTGSLHLFGGDGKRVADRIRAQVRETYGLTLSVGVSFNKVFAKLGSDYQKPDATTVIGREDVPRMVWPLPVTDLLFAGRAAEKVLRQYGIVTIGQLAACSREKLVLILGKQGGQLSDYARGLEHGPVLPLARQAGPKSVGNGSTFPRDLSGEREIRNGLAMLSDEVAARLRAYGLCCATLQVTIRAPDFTTITRQRGLDRPTDLARELTAVGMELVRAVRGVDAPVRMLTVTAQNLIPREETATQLDLFAPDSLPRRDRVETVERTMDKIRGKYGRDSIFCGHF